MITSTDHRIETARNPGPCWGYHFLRSCDHLLPKLIFKLLRAAGTWIALACMPSQRQHSRDYLRITLGREPTLYDVFRHFFTFEEALMLKLSVANGRPHTPVVAPGSEHFVEHLRSGQRALLGTFHVGHSDLLGFVLGPRERHRVFMVRQRVANSHDTEILAKRSGGWLQFIWVNEPENLLFALKEAVATGGSIAMKCDRIEFSSKTESFEFLGARRIFPFTIYHLALIFKMPVLLSVGVPGEANTSILHSSPLWEPAPATGKTVNLASARTHFQNFLHQLEKLLREDPYLWFNFTALNPTEAPAGLNSGSVQPPASQSLPVV